MPSGVTLRRTSTASASASARHVHRAADRRRHRARAGPGDGRRARGRLDARGARRRGRRPTRARARRARRAPRRGVRRRLPRRRAAAGRRDRHRARGARRRCAIGAAPTAGWRWGTGRYDFGTGWSRRPRSPADDSTLHRVSAPWPCAGSARRPARRPRRPSAGVRAPARRRAPPMTAALDIRRLTYADLPQVIAIERRAFPTPWSLAMFVLELSSPAASAWRRAPRRQPRRLPDLLALRHGLARDERRRRPGRPRTRRRHHAADALLERVGDDSARFTLEVRTVQRRRHRALRALRLPRRRHAPALLPGQRRGRAHHVAHAGDASAARSRTCRTPGRSGRWRTRSRSRT